MSAVLDTSAILAALWGEQGSDRVEQVIEGAVISSVNLAELIAKLADRGAEAEQVEEILSTLGLEVNEFDTRQAGVSGDLRRSTRHQGLSLGDRCCLALAVETRLPVLTADRAWSRLDVGVEIEVIR